jgi:alpha-L-fucosidase
MWFDYSFDNYNGEKWKAKELLNMVRKYQPDILLDNRLEINNGTASTARMVSSVGDFETPEQGIPDGPLIDKYGNNIPWETCLTLNNNWGYYENDKNWKSPELIVQCLVNCVSKNGNMLLNVGPDARGNIPDESLCILNEVGEWMDKNSESIYGCGATSLTKPDWGRYTKKGNTIYAHWMYPNLGEINAKGITDKVKNVYLLSSGAELNYHTTWWGNNETGNFFINVEKPTTPTGKLDSVIKIELK